MEVIAVNTFLSSDACISPMEKVWCSVKLCTKSLMRGWPFGDTFAKCCGCIAMWAALSGFGKVRALA